MKLRELFSEHYQPTRLRGGRNTVRLYGCVMNRLTEHFGREPDTSDLQNNTIAKYLDSRSSQVSPHTVERERTQILALWRFACVHRIGSVESMPDVPAGRLPQKIPTAWTAEEMKLLMVAARMTPGTIAGREAGNFFHALIFTAWITAERIGALMSLTPRDLVDPYLSIRAERGRGKSARSLHLRRRFSISFTTSKVDRESSSGTDRRLCCGATSSHLEESRLV